MGGIGNYIHKFLILISFFGMLASCNSKKESSVTTGGTVQIKKSSITSTGPIVADGSSPATVIIKLYDSTGNPTGAVTPLFKATDTGHTNVYGPCQITPLLGVYKCTMTSTKAEAKTLTITYPELVTGGTVTFSAGAADPLQCSITGTTPVSADGVDTSFISIVLKDTNGNPMQGEVPSFMATNTGGTNIYGACSAADVTGTSVCTLSSLVAEVKTLQLVSPVSVVGTNVTFVPGAPSATTSTIFGTSPVVANGVATSTVTITIRDAGFNPIPGQTPTFSATDTGATNSYSACSMSDAGGVSTCTMTSTKAEVKTLSIVTPVVKAGGNVTFQAGTPVAANSNITGTTPTTANGTSVSTISIVLRDAFLNPVPGQTPTFSATDTGSTNVYSACSATDATGTSTCTLKSTKAETKTLSITTPFMKADGTVVFQAGLPAAANTTITGTGPVTADGVSTSTITITLADAANNPVIGTVPTFSATDTGGGNAYSVCSSSDASGISTCTLISTKAELKTLSLTSPIIKADGTVQFDPGSPDATQSTITGSSPVVADGVATSTVTITIKDAQGNPISGENPTFVATDTNTTNSYSVCSATDTSGIATCTLSATKAELKTLSLTAPVSKTGGAVNFVAGTAVIANSSITGTGPVVADGVTASTVTIHLEDVYNNPLIGTVPTFDASGTANNYGVCSATDTNGDSTCALSSSTAETKTLGIVTPIVKTDGSVVFEAGSAVAANSTIVGSGPVVANGVATSTVTITLHDITNNPVPGITPTFDATDTGTTNAYSACSVSDASGISTCTLSSTKAELKTLSLVTPFAKADGAVLFTADAPSVATSTISGTGTVVADGVATSTVSVTLKDVNNNPVSGSTPTFSATNTGSTNIYSACSVSDTSGLSSCTLKSLKAELKTLSITTPVSKSDGTVLFVAGAASAATTTIVGTTPVVADGVDTSTITITILDVNSNPRAGDTPIFTATDTGVTNGYGACSVSDSSGVSTCSLSSLQVETKNLQLNSPVSVTGSTVDFVAGDAVPANSTIAGTGPVTADGVSTSTVTITLKDALNNPVIGTTPTFNATNTSSTNSYGACSATDSTGVATCTFTSTKAETKTLSITSPISKSDGTVDFVAGSVASATSQITGSSPVVADGTAQSTISITLVDAFLNPIAGVTPTFSATDTGTTNSYGACSATNGAGVSTCTLASTKAETKTLSITSPVSKTDGSVTFVADVAIASQSSITGTGPVAADGSSTSTVTVTLRDNNANPVIGQTPTFGATDTGVTNSYGACSASNTSGVSTCTLSSTKAETKTLAILTPVSKSDGTVDFVAAGASIANSSITGTTPVVANGVATSTVTITLIDAFSNPVIGTTPTFAATDTSSGNTYGACSATDSSGVSTCTLASTKAEVKTLAILTPIAKNGTDVTFTPGAAAVATSTITGSGPVTADGSATSTITITIKDAQNNAIAGTTPTFSATDTGATNSYGACSATDASGVSTCTLSSTKAETKTLSISSPVSKAGGTVVFSGGSPVIANSSISGTGPVDANGVSTSTVTILLKDVNSNPSVGITPTFSATDTSSGNSYGVCSSSDATGSSICTLSSTFAETKTLSIQTPIIKSGGTVDFVIGTADPANSTITGTGPVVADGSATSTVTITLKDSANNPVIGETPTFSATDTGTTNAYAACSATNLSGVSTCTFTSTKAEIKTLSIATPISKTDGTVTFSPGSASSVATTITGTTPVVADGVATSFITITILDANSNPISGVTPIYNATDTGTTNTYGACSSSNASGVSSCTLASTVAESKVLQLTSPTAVTGDTVVFSPGGAVSINSTIAGTSPVTADGSSTSTVTITLRDINNNPVPGETPTFSATDTGSVNSYGACSLGNSSGVSTCTLSSTKAEVKTLSITAPISKSDGTVSFNPGSASIANSSITGTGPVEANGVSTSTITITLKDAQNNSIVGTTPTFSATNTGSSNSYGACSATNASGVSTCTLSSSNAETKTLSLVSPISKSDGTVVFTVPVVTLAFADGSTYDFGDVPLGGSKDLTILVNYSGSGNATGVGASFNNADFTFKGGSFPGTGGTCSATVSGNCSVVVTYTPSSAASDTADLTLSYNEGSDIVKDFLGNGVSLTPTKLLVTGPGSVIINNCITYQVKATTSDGTPANVTANKTVSLVVNNGTGTFYSNSGCTTTITNTTITNGTSSKTIYFKSTTAGQNLTLIFNTTGLTNTSLNVNTSNAPTAIVASASAELETTTCSAIQVNLVDGAGTTTGASTSKTINITHSTSAVFYNDVNCTQSTTSIAFAAYEGQKNVYVKDAVEETASITFTDAGSILSSDNISIDFVDALTWWDTDWNKRMAITLNNLDQATAFTDMPILIRLNSSKVSYADFLSGGADVRFTLDDHTTVLNYEIESWNSSGESLIWVRIPSLSASSQHTIYLYYNNSLASGAENPAGLWTGYSGVWNMKKSGADYVDSTGSGKTAAPVGTITDSTGPSGSAIYFNGSSKINTGYNLAQIIGRTSTLSFWMRSTQVGNNTNWQAPGITGIEEAGGGNDIFFGFVRGDGTLAINSGNTGVVASNFVVNDDNWRYVTMSRDETSGAVKFYVNGVLNGSGTSETGYKSSAFTGFGVIEDTGGTPNYFNGYLDSLRLRPSVETDARIKAEYKFMVETHLTYASPENL